MTKKYLLFALCFVLSHVFIESTCYGLTLAENGKSQYVIVVDHEANAAEKTAANELADFLSQVTQCKLPIVTEKDASEKGKRILVGQSQTVRELLPDVKWDQLGQDGIVIKTVGDDLILAGGRPRGTLYAVYTFLEDVVGCRWWTSTESNIPSKPKLDVPSLDIVYTPKFHYRETLFADVHHAGNYRFMARLKLNGHHHRALPEAYGGNRDIIGFVHTFYHLLPPAKYFKEHPEWYSLLRGKRSSERRSQLCLTNKEMQKELVKNALEWIKRNPDQNIISISQNDSGSGGCECPSCLAVLKREGSQAGPLLLFVNQVARELEKHHPDMLVETLSYSYTRKPPRYVRPRKNVIIRLCDISANFLEPLNSRSNKVFANDLKHWSKIAPRLFIWDYVVNFGHPLGIHPNLHVLGPNLRLFADNNVGGVFEQGWHSTKASEFNELKTWMLGHLMWNPYQDDKKLMADFLNGYYGPAGEFIGKYIELVRSAFVRDNVYMTCGNADFTALRLADMNAATDLFAKACEVVKGDAKLEGRVLRARIPLDRMWIIKWNDLQGEARRTQQPFAGPENPKQAITELVERAKRLGVSGVRPAYLTKLLNVPASVVPAKAPNVGVSLKGKQWIDVQEKQFRCPIASDQCRLAEDSQASDNVAAVMPGNHTEWLVQYDLKYEGHYRYYAIVRADVDNTKPQEGIALECGVYRGNVKRKISVKEIADGKYHAFDLGVHWPNGQYLYVAPAMSSAVKNVYVDRIILVKER